ncbi:hypothetical protein Tco_0139486 [Tanacetum coccineum]
MTRSSNTKVFTPFANPERQFQSRKDITPIAVHNIYSFYESKSLESESEDLSDIDIETLTLEQYLALNRNNSQVRVKRREIKKSIVFEIKSQLLRELRENTFSGGKAEDSMEHLRKILEIASLFNTPGISGNDIMLQNFLLTPTRAAKSNALADLGANISVMPFSMFKCLEVGKQQVIFNANEGATPITVSPVYVIQNFNVIDNIDGPNDLEEFLMNDNLNGDLGNFLQDNNLFPNYEINSPYLDKSSREIWSPTKGFQDFENDFGSRIDELVAIDDLWGDLDSGALNSLLYKKVEFKVPLTRIHILDKLSILAKDKGFGQEMHQSEESKALYGVTSPKDYAVTYSNKEMSHHTLYDVKCLHDYAATFKYTRDDVSDSALRRNICGRGNAGSQRKCNHSIGNEMVRSSNIKVFTPFANPERQFRGRKDITPIAVHNIYSFYESKSSESDSEDLSDIDIETLTLEQYLALNLNNSQVGVKRLEIEKSIVFEIKSQLLRELRENTFSGGKTEDAMEHLRKIFEISGLFNTPGILGNDIMLRIFPLTLKGAAKR